MSGGIQEIKPNDKKIRPTRSNTPATPASRSSPDQTPAIPPNWPHREHQQPQHQRGQHGPTVHPGPPRRPEQPGLRSDPTTLSSPKPSMVSMQQSTRHASSHTRSSAGLSSDRTSMDVRQAYGGSGRDYSLELEERPSIDEVLNGPVRASKEKGSGHRRIKSIEAVLHGSGRYVLDSLRIGHLLIYRSPFLFLILPHARPVCLFWPLVVSPAPLPSSLFSFKKLSSSLSASPSSSSSMVLLVFLVLDLFLHSLPCPFKHVVNLATLRTILPLRTTLMIT